jgi:hypothetical protein
MTAMPWRRARGPRETVVPKSVPPLTRRRLALVEPVLSSKTEARSSAAVRTEPL